MEITFDSWNIKECVTSELGGYLSLTDKLKLNRKARRFLGECSAPISFNKTWSVSPGTKHTTQHSYFLVSPTNLTFPKRVFPSTCIWNTEYSLRNQYDQKNYYAHTKEHIIVSTASKNYLEQVSNLETELAFLHFKKISVIEEFHLINCNVLSNDFMYPVNDFDVITNNMWDSYLLDILQEEIQPDKFQFYNPDPEKFTLKALEVNKKYSKFHIEANSTFPQTHSLLTKDIWIVSIEKSFCSNITNLFEENWDKRSYFRLVVQKLPEQKKSTKFKEKFPWRFPISTLKTLNWDIFKMRVSKEQLSIENYSDEIITIDPKEHYSFQKLKHFRILHDTIFLIDPTKKDKIFKTSLTKAKRPASSLNNLSILISKKKKMLKERDTTVESSIQSSFLQMLVVDTNSTQVAIHDTSSLIKNQSNLSFYIQERSFVVPLSCELKMIVVSYENMDGKILSALYQKSNLMINELDTYFFNSKCNIIINPYNCVLFIDVYKFFQKTVGDDSLYYIPIIRELAKEYENVHCIITNVFKSAPLDGIKCEIMLKNIFLNIPEVCVYSAFDTEAACSIILYLTHNKTCFDPSMQINPISYDENIMLLLGFNLFVAKTILLDCTNIANLLQTPHLSKKHALKIQQVFCFQFKNILPVT